MGDNMAVSLGQDSLQPVVVVPGILGSRLVHKDGRILWGNRGSLNSFSQLDLDPSGQETEITAAGLVDNIRMLGPFWTAHFYDNLLGHLRELGFREGHTLFVFAYDWRQSNYETARRLGSWVDEQPALHDGKFDIVAHSMGGIVARIWMLQHGGAQRVRKAIYLGTPFQGSMNALAILSSGWGTFLNYVAGGIDLIRSTVLSFPSLYELFPRYGKSCRFGNQKEHEFVNIYDPRLWNAHDWLPDSYRDGRPRANLFRKSLERGEELGNLMAGPIQGAKEIKIAGDYQSTRLYLYANRDDKSWRNWTFRYDRGDGIVPLWSAANSPDGNLAGSYPAFAEHATIFHDKWVESLLQRELVITRPPPVSSEVPTMITRSGAVRLDVMDAWLEPPIVAPGARVRLTVKLRFPAGAHIVRGDISGLIAHFAGTEADDIALSETTDDRSMAEGIVSFTADFHAPPNEETYRIDIEVPPLGQRSVYLCVERPS